MTTKEKFIEMAKNCARQVYDGCAHDGRTVP